MTKSLRPGTVSIDKPVSEMTTDEVRTKMYEGADHVDSSTDPQQFAEFLEVLSIVVEGSTFNSKDTGSPEEPPKLDTNVLADQFAAAVKVLELHYSGAKRPTRMSTSDKIAHVKQSVDAFSLGVSMMHFSLYEVGIMMNRRPAKDALRNSFAHMTSRTMPGFYSELITTFNQLASIVSAMTTEMEAADYRAQLRELGKEKTALQSALENALEKIEPESPEDGADAGKQQEARPKTRATTRTTRTAPKVEAPKADAPKVEAPKVEAPKGQITVSVKGVSPEEQKATAAKTRASTTPPQRKTRSLRK